MVLKFFSLSSFTDPLEQIQKNFSHPLKVRIHPTAKRLTLRFDSSEQTFLLITPKHASQKNILHFLDHSQPWVQNQFLKAKPKIPFSPESTLSILGKKFTIKHLSRKTKMIWMNESEILIHCPLEELATTLKTWLKNFAKTQLEDLAHNYAKKLGCSFNKIVIRDYKGRWGSCSPSKVLSFSWRLIFAPQDVFSYVCAHEVAHLREMNHSEHFWKLVAFLSADYKTHRQWLRSHGNSLFLYGA